MSKLPGFLGTKETPMNTAPTPSPVRPLNAVEAANQLGDHVARMLEENARLTEELRLSRLHNETLIAQLDVAERDRDHFRKKSEYFERFSMSIATNFNTIRMIIDDTQRKANEFAKTEAPAQEPRTQEAPAENDRLGAVEAALNDLQQNGK